MSYAYGPYRAKLTGHFVEHLLEVGRTAIWRKRNTLRNVRLEAKPYQCWELPACVCRWRAAHPHQPLGRQRVCQPWTPHRATKSLSVKKKSRTSAWRRSMSSTRKTPEHPGPTYSLSEEVADAVAAADEAADEAAAAEAAEAAEAAVCRGELAASARLEHFPITLIDAGRYGRV